MSFSSPAGNLIHTIRLSLVFHEANHVLISVCDGDSWDIKWSQKLLSLMRRVGGRVGWIKRGKDKEQELMKTILLRETTESCTD